MEHSDSSSISAVDIAPDGDVIFIVGTERRRLRVFSLFLKSASSVFKAMLGPYFAEGQSLRGADPVEIPLPEDDTEALSIIFNVLHGRNDSVPDSLNGSQIRHIATAADKYDLVTPLRFAIQRWLNCSGVNDPRELWQLMVASFWFGNAKGFADISHALILYYADSYSELAIEGGLNPDVLLRVCMSLEEERNRLRLELLEILFRASTFHTITCPCGWNAKHCLSFIESLRWNTHLWPLSVRGQTIWKAAEAVRETESPSPEDMDISCPKPNYHRIWKLDFRAKLAMMIDEFKNYNGLCLVCVSTGEQHSSHKEDTALLRM